MPAFAMTSALLFLVLFGFHAAVAHALVYPATAQALQQLYASTQGDTWYNRTNWLLGDPCANEWFGVRCSSSGSFLGLQLGRNHVVGNLPMVFFMSAFSVSITVWLNSFLPVNLYLAGGLVRARLLQQL